MSALWLGKILLAYLLGSVSGSLMVGRLRGVDIRTQGSGNAGGTNAFRTQGLGFALATVLVDVGKGALAAWLGGLPIADDAGGLSPALLASAAAILGHVWPAFHGFRGGKGAGTMIGALLVLWPFALVPVLLVWLLSLSLTGFVGLSTMLAGIALIPTAWFFRTDHDARWLIAAAVIAAFLVFTHRSNIRKMRDGQEYCFAKAQIWKRLLRQSARPPV
ncbi:acyl-phosphate glycerol 3-phosphate acyltransferase [Ahniella affigens]|uniref:Glycerol-3-phosphate acyltransferase n=1 Tax=Ahniella affigens TaxID=2021234 RepID=A0A2P1PXU3_9GAMM|nr:glycerol-3-phosphate 1-O-acyltransferase PlsY [Ahniella affigens]AVP99650.1 acyl-phosphate glycerol 3-phosphate acyltransferase [Ahniella affigens]